jgi:hypothetical protein
VVEGVKKSNGKIITLLDYDDRYLSNRLQVILEEFTGDPNLGFFHNSIECIGKNGEPLSRGLPLFLRGLNLQRRQLVTDREKNRSSPRMGFSMPDFNGGSIAIRREVVEFCLPYLQRVQMCVDSLLFYAAWETPFSIMADPRKLTQYRIHSGSISAESTMPASQSVAQTEEFKKVWFDDVQVVLEMVDKGHHAELQRDVRFRMFANRTMDALWDPSVSRRRAWEIATELRLYLRPIDLSPGFLKIAMFTLLTLISPRILKLFPK